MDFIFKKEHREICYEIFKTSQDYKPLCNLAEITATIDGNKYTVPENELLLLQEGIDKGVVKIEDGKAFFTEEIYCIFFLALKNIEEFVDCFNKEKEFIKKLEEYSHMYQFEISLHIPEMTLVILGNLYKLPLVDKLTELLNVLTKSEYEYLFNYFASVIPYLNINNEQIISFLENVNNKYPKEFINNFNIRQSFHLLGIEKSSQAEQLLDTIINNQNLVDLAFNILIGLSESIDCGFIKAYQKAFNIINETTHTGFRSALLACAKFKYGEHFDYKEKTYNKFVELTNISDLDVSLSLVRAFNYFLEQEERSKEWLLHFSQSNNKDILEEVAWSLSINKHRRNEEWYKDTLLNLTSIREPNNIYRILYFYIKEDSEIVFKFLDKWLVESKENEGDLTKIFPIFQEIFNKQRQLLQKYITKWINNDSYIIHNYLSDIFHNLGVHKVTLELDKKELDLLSDKDIEYIIIKILGYVTYGKELLCCLIFSILNREPESNFINSIVIDVFTNYIAYNFPGYSSEFLKIKISKGNDLEKRIAKEIIIQIDIYHNSLEKLSQIKELAPSDSRIDYYNKIYNKYFQKIYKETEKNSLVSSIFPIDRTPVKGGNKFFFKMDGEYREKNPFTQITSSEELNKGDHIDPIGMENLRMHWRLYKRK